MSTQFDFTQQRTIFEKYFYIFFFQKFYVVEFTGISQTFCSKCVLALTLKNKIKKDSISSQPEPILKPRNCIEDELLYKHYQLPNSPESFTLR